MLCTLLNYYFLHYQLRHNLFLYITVHLFGFCLNWIISFVQLSKAGLAMTLKHYVNIKRVVRSIHGYFPLFIICLIKSILQSLLYLTFPMDEADIYAWWNVMKIKEMCLLMFEWWWEERLAVNVLDMNGELGYGFAWEGQLDLYWSSMFFHHIMKRFIIEDVII